MGEDSINKRQRGNLAAAVETMFRADRPAWLRVATTSAYFAIVGPLVGFLVALVPLGLVFLAIPFFAPLGVSIFLVAYPVGLAPAAITGAYAALVSPAMRPPASVSFYLSSAMVGGATTFVWVALNALQQPTQEVRSAGAAFGFAVLGAVATIFCLRLARIWPLGRTV